MFPFGAPDDSGVRPLSDEDSQLLLGLAQRYGLQSILCALTNFGEPSRSSTFSANTLLSNVSAPSLAWTSSEASQCRSDDASIQTQCTWPEPHTEVPSVHEPDQSRLGEQSWLDSPAAVASPMPPNDVTSHPSPRLVAPTSKKYQCPMCFLDNSPVGFGRKSDFKKHLHNFHGADVVWICRTKGCHLSFTTERAYSTHAKDAHRMKALPNSAARTDLCPQLVFSCGFASCKDRFFEAADVDEASATRDKHFEHIAKHFEDGFDVNAWEYRVLVQNLMRQHQVKSIFKTCIWPKEKRQQLVWRSRSSGDLKRMLEARHLGNDVSNLVRLAYILGTSPFTSANTPPPSEIEMYFQLPARSGCLVHASANTDVVAPTPDESSQTDSPALSKPNEGCSSPTSKHKPSVTSSMFKLPGRQVKRETRPTTPASAAGDTVMADDMTAGPHPGTPFPIPNETVWPVDAPKFAPEAPTSLPKQMNTPVDTPMMYHLPTQENHQAPWVNMDAFPDYPTDNGMVNAMNGMNGVNGLNGLNGFYDYSMNTSQPSTVRPPTPAPTKRPASWSRVMSMETLRPHKKASQQVNMGQDPGNMVHNIMGI